MRAILSALAALSVVGCGNSRAAPAPEPAGAIRPVAQSELCVTRGAVAVGQGAARITEPTVRAVVPGAHGDAAELRFVYRGATAEQAELASGQTRRQIGLKLRAADGCNLVYVMWRFAPGKPRVEVSVKHNPGDTTHAQCGAGGYRKLSPERVIELAEPVPGSAHTLTAKISGDHLTARVDGEVVWHGRLPRIARGLHGPAGLRSDNVAVDDIQVLAAPVADRTRIPRPATCRKALAADQPESQRAN